MSDMFCENIKNERPALVTPRETFFYSDFILLRKSFKSQLTLIKGRKVVLNGLDALALAKLIPILEAVAETVLIIPDNIEHHVVSSFVSKINISFSLSLSGKKINIEKLNEKNEIVAMFTETKWIIPTSGTTGRPKLVQHTLKSLTRTTVKKKAVMQNSWGLSYELSRFAGLQVFLQSYLSGSTLIIPDNTDNLIAQLKFFVAKGCTGISGTPSYWRKVLVSGQAKKLNLKRITLGGEIADKSILDSLVKAYPNAKIVHIYASTEAGVGFSVFDAQEGFPFDYITSGYEGVKIKIDNDNCLLLKNEKYEQKYVGDIKLVDMDGYVNTGDVVKVINERVFFVGRNSGSINVGGNKVHPEEVESIINRLPDVISSLVYGKKNPILGALVIAKIEIVNKAVDVEKLKNEIRIECKKELESFKVPVQIKIVDKIQVSQTGKVVRGLV